MIKSPICLTDMKAKAKRQDYTSKEEFMLELTLLRQNAELFNGPMSEFARLSRVVEQKAVEEVEKQEQEIQSLELLA